MRRAMRPRSWPSCTGSTAAVCPLRPPMPWSAPRGRSGDGSGSSPASSPDGRTPSFARPAEQRVSEAVLRRESRLAAAVGWNVSGQSGVLALGLVSAIVTARILGPADRGALGVLLTAPTLVIALLSFGVPTASGYFASSRPTVRRGLVGNTLLLGACIATVTLPAAWMFRHAFAAMLTHGRHDG